MSILVIDVETLPLAASLAQPYPDADRLPPSNYSKPEAIASWREKDRAAWQDQRIKECSLTPRLGRIACLGYALNDEDPTTVSALTEESERTLLMGFWNLIPKANRLVTFNGSFDLRFLAVRSAVLGIDPMLSAGVSWWFRRYTTSPHFDCRAVLTGWDDRQTGKLGEWCATFGIPCENGVSGSDVYALAQLGEWDAIADHCRADVGQTRELYRKIAPLFQ